MDLPELLEQRITADEETVADRFERRARDEASRYDAHPEYREEWRP